MDKKPLEVLKTAVLEALREVTSPQEKHLRELTQLQQLELMSAKQALAVKNAAQSRNFINGEDDLVEFATAEDRIRRSELLIKPLTTALHSVRARLNHSQLPLRHIEELEGHLKAAEEAFKTLSGLGGSQQTNIALVAQNQLSAALIKAGEALDTIRRALPDESLQAAADQVEQRLIELSELTPTQESAA